MIEKQTASPAILAKRRLFTFAPLGFIPALAMLFHIFGGGENAVANEIVEKKQFDTNLPDAKSKDIATKSEAYIQAEEEDKNIITDFDVDNLASASTTTSERALQAPKQKEEGNANEDVAKVLQDYYNNRSPRYAPSPNERYVANRSYNDYSTQRPTPKTTAIVDAEDQEQQQAPKNKESKGKQVEETSESLFFGSSSKKGRVKDGQSGAILFRAVVHGEQSVTPNSLVKLRTTEAVTINGTTIPANSFLFGSANFSNDERLILKINSIRVKQDVIPVNMTVYDSDGQEGIRVVGGELKEKTDQIVDNVDAPSSMSNIPIIGNVAETTKNLLRKKKRNSTIVIGANYKLLIKSI